MKINPYKKLTVYKDSYDKDGITYTRAKDFAVIYHDADKRKGGIKRYINGGFFGNYRSETKTNFILMRTKNGKIIA